MTTSAPPVRAPLTHWDRARLIPSRRQLALAVALALAGAVAINPITMNPFVEVLGETLFVAMVLLFGYKVAGAWRQTWLPRWVGCLFRSSPT